MRTRAYNPGRLLKCSDWERRRPPEPARDLPGPAGPLQTGPADYWHFLSRFALRPWTIGAIAPSSARLAHTVLDHCNFTTARTVVELGAGCGAITSPILRRLHPRRSLRRPRRSRTSFRLPQSGERHASSSAHQQTLPRRGYPRRRPPIQTPKWSSPARFGHAWPSDCTRTMSPSSSVLRSIFS